MKIMRMKDIIEELLIEFHKEALHNYINDDEMGLQELAENYTTRIIEVLYGKEEI